MNDMQIRFENLVTAVEYIQANSHAELITINSLAHGIGLAFSFVDKNNKACSVTVYAGAVTPEATQVMKIYRKK
jgi:hypothetical protein